MAGKECTIQVLADGKFVYDGYGYDSLDELLSDLKSDLSSEKESEEVEVTEKKKNVKKIMEDDDAEY